MAHVPVLLREVIDALRPTSPEKYIDATVGEGGHTIALLEHSKPKGQVLGLDQDRSQLANLKQRLGQEKRLKLACDRYSNLGVIAEEYGFTKVAGILFDLGVSSRQLTKSQYGLNFRDSTPLDMRLSSQRTETAADFLNHANQVEIADTLYRWGDRRNSRGIARRILGYRARQGFATAGDLKAALGTDNPAYLAPIFQALRIWVNDEEEELTKALPQAVRLLKPGGRLVVISYHSGEDRLVKQFLRQARPRLASRAVIRPTWAETQDNPRARSAKLRLATKLA